MLMLWLSVVVEAGHPITAVTLLPLVVAVRVATCRFLTLTCLLGR
jgi:hypothetical protein